MRRHLNPNTLVVGVHPCEQDSNTDKLDKRIDGVVSRTGDGAEKQDGSRLTDDLVHRMLDRSTADSCVTFGEYLGKDDFGSEAERSDWRILIGEGTMERLDGAFRAQDLGNHALKGKNEPIRIFRILGASEVDRPPSVRDPE